MPRAKSDDVKSSAELDAEIKELLGKINAKKKASKAAKQREDREAAQAREYEEAKFNQKFVEMAKQIQIRDCIDYADKTIYEAVKRIMAKQESAQSGE